MKQDALQGAEKYTKAHQRRKRWYQVVTGLMTSGSLEPAVYAKETSELQAELERLQAEKSTLSQNINGSLVNVEEAQKLLRFIGKTDALTAFDDETFLEYVNELRVLSREEIVFHLKCGLKLKERLVRA